jgi:hypothetical protein
LAEESERLQRDGITVAEKAGESKQEPCDCRTASRFCVILVIIIITTTMHQHNDPTDALPGSLVRANIASKPSWTATIVKQITRDGTSLGQLNCFLRSQKAYLSLSSRYQSSPKTGQIFAPADGQLDGLGSDRIKRKCPREAEIK